MDNNRGNTRIKCYGELFEISGKIESEFDWAKILSAVNAPPLQMAENGAYYTLEEDGTKLTGPAHIVPHGRELLIRPHIFPHVKLLEPILKDAAAAQYRCAADVRIVYREEDSHHLFGPEILVSLYRPHTEAVCGFREGDTAEFGRYPQDGSGKPMPVRWKVLAVAGGEAILIAEDCLIRSGYCDSKKAYGNAWYLSWANSLAREMCCGKFYHDAFDLDEQKCVVPCRMDEAMNGAACTDEVFLLSEGQTRLFMPDPKDRQAVPSRALLEEKEPKVLTGYRENRNNTAWWILPEEQGNRIYPKAVWPDGEIQYHGRNIGHADFTIRPCVRVSLPAAGTLLKKVSGPPDAVLRPVQDPAAEDQSPELPEKKQIPDHRGPAPWEKFKPGDPDKVRYYRLASGQILKHTAEEKYYLFDVFDRKWHENVVMQVEMEHGEVFSWEAVRMEEAYAHAHEKGADADRDAKYREDEKGK